MEKGDNGKLLWRCIGPTDVGSWKTNCPQLVLKICLDHISSLK